MPDESRAARPESIDASSPTSNLQPPTSNLQPPTSNLQPPILQPPILLAHVYFDAARTSIEHCAQPNVATHRRADNVTSPLGYEPAVAYAKAITCAKQPCFSHHAKSTKSTHISLCATLCRYPEDQFPDFMEEGDHAPQEAWRPFDKFPP